MTRLFPRNAQVAAVFFAALFAWALPAAAQQVALSIAPLGSTLLVKAGDKTVQEVFNLTNSGDGDATFEVQVFSWAQDESGAPVYTPSDEFLVFPKTLTIQPGKTRAIRLMRRATGYAIPDAQRYFRVQFREIPRSFSSGERDEMRISLVTRVLVPVVLQNAAFQGEGELVVRQTAQGLRLANTGAALLKLSSAYCGEERVSGLVYVQPGASVLLANTTCAQPLRVAREGQEDTSHEISRPE